MHYCLRAYWLKFLPFNAPLSFFSLLVANPEDWISYSIGRGFQVNDHMQSCVPCHKVLGLSSPALIQCFFQHGNCKLYHLLALGGTIPDFQTQSSWKHWQIATAVRDTDWTGTGAVGVANATLLPVLCHSSQRTNDSWAHTRLEASHLLLPQQAGCWGPLLPADV